MKLCVIGAGAAGLSAIKNGVEHGCEVTCFELSDKVGGLWNLTDQIGTDENGVEIHSSMYHGLVTNLPIEVMSYPDLSFPAQKESYVASDKILNYYQWYAEKFDLKKFVMFQSLVVQVRPLADETWEVVVKDIKTGSFETYLFDAVLICSGHFHSSSTPKYEGQNIYKGKQFHSHDYRKSDSLRDEKVLIVGGSFSGSDIVEQSAKFAKQVTWSHHQEKPDQKYFADNVDQKPDIGKFTENGVEFVDGTVGEFTVVIFCTGYNFSFPFLSVDSGISTEDGYVKPLYMHCLSIEKPSLGIIGMSSLICPNQMFDLQIRFCLAFMTGKKQLPSKQQMMIEYNADMENRWNRGVPKKRAHDMGGEIQERYYIDLAEKAGTNPIKPHISKMHAQSLLNRKNDFGGFRNIKFEIVDDDNFKMYPIK